MNLAPLVAARATDAADATSPAHLQADALIEEMAQKVAQVRDELQGVAEQEARQIRQRARTKARQRLRRAIAEMRAAQAQRTQQLHAELETASRQQASVRAQQTLDAAWPRLAEAIEARWSDPVARAHWLAAQLALARSRLPGQAWTVRHPGAWGAAELATLRDAMVGQGERAATLQSDTRLTTGLVIEVGGARLDSTPAALLADRPQVEAVLLSLFEPATAQGAPR